MEKAKVDQFLMLYSSKIPASSIPMVREKLSQCEDETSAMMVASQMKDPTVALVLSICVGFFAVDRFYIGDVGLGLCKLLTCGGVYIWWIIDLFLIMDATKNKNLELLRYL